MMVLMGMMMWGGASHLFWPAAPFVPAPSPSQLALPETDPQPAASEMFSLLCGLPLGQTECPLDPATACLHSEGIYRSHVLVLQWITAKCTKGDSDSVLTQPTAETFCWDLPLLVL